MVCLTTVGVVLAGTSLVVGQASSTRTVTRSAVLTNTTEQPTSTTATTTQTQQTQTPSLNQLLQTVLQPTQTGTTTTGTPTTGTTGQEQEGPGTTAPTGTRQTVVTNQFTSATGAGIQQRRPGLWVEQGIAEHEGTLEIPGDVPAEEPNFFRQTFDQMFQNVLGLFSNILTAVDGLVTSLGSSSSGGGGTSTITFVPPPNASTTWQSGSQTIP
jgi:hypothetical protein